MTVNNKFITYPGNTTGRLKAYQKIDVPNQKVKRSNNKRKMLLVLTYTVSKSRTALDLFFYFVENSGASSMQRRIIFLMFSKYESICRLKLGNRDRRGEAEAGEKINNRTHCLCNTIVRQL